MEFQLPLKLQAAPGVWLARADRHCIAQLGEPLSAIGSRSVLLVREWSADTEGKFLIAGSRSFQVANLGASKELLVVAVEDIREARVDGNCFPETEAAEVCGGADPNQRGGSEVPTGLAPTDDEGFDSDWPADDFFAEDEQHDFVQGDHWFLQRIEGLQAQLREIGVLIYTGVRAASPRGKLRYYKKSKRFVESPDNFWTICFQPRCSDFVITVRGEPEEFKTESIVVKRDRGTYSRFKVTRLEEVDEAVRLILSARRRSGGGRPR